MTHKKTWIIAIYLLAGILLFTNCKKDEETAAEVSQDDAAEMMEATLMESTGGVTETVEKSSEEIVTDYALFPDCSQSFDTTYNFTHTGVRATANYSISWGYLITCNLGVPSSMALQATSAGTYSTNRISSNDNTTGNLNITGLQPSATNLTFSGNLARNGTQSLTINSKTHSITSTITLTLTNIVVNKTTYQIQSGTGSALLTADNGTNTYTFSGSIVFNGGGSATLNINGTEYQFDLN